MSSFDKKDIALSIVKSNSLNTTQIKQVLAELTSSFFQKEVAIAAYSNCTDQKNYEKIIDTFSSSLMKNDVRAETTGK